MKLSAIPYYFSSIPKLISHTNFWYAPLVMISPNTLTEVGKYSFYIGSIMDYWTLKEVILDDCYLIESVIEAGGGTIIDIGASIGDFSIKSEKKGADRVYAYECNTQRIELMKKNMNLNGCDRINLISEKILSLDKIFKDNQITHCNFLKIDCEGCEYQIFENSHNSIDKVDFIAMEAHFFNAKMQDQFKKMKQFLLNHNFDVSIEQNPVHDTICYLYAQKDNS